MIDETGYAAEPKKKKMGIRSAVMASLETGTFFMRLQKGVVARMTDLGSVLRTVIAEEHDGGFIFKQRKKGLMKVDALVEQWIEAVVGLCTAHDKDTYDAHDARADELLGPLLSAPVKDIREFYVKLQAKMRDDKRVPMIVWMGFEAWGEVMVKNAPDEGVKRLEKKLAGEIAELVEADIRDQIPEAIKRALQWRDPETLQAVKDTIESGAKPKLRGRESCLFLECGRGKKKVSVML